MANTYVDKNGYKRYSNSNKSVHKYVAERKLGGDIYNGHVVHHKDENKLNNSRKNLQVMKRSSHSRLHAKKRNSYL